MLRTGDKPSRCLTGEGRREGAGQQPALPHRSGGVSVGSTSGSSTKVSWEISGTGAEPHTPAQAGKTSEARVGAGEVGVLHSDAIAALDAGFRGRKPPKAQREDTCSMRRGEAMDAGMAGATRIITLDKVRQLQIALYRKAKAEPGYRFWSLYGELLRQDVLETALAVQRRNGGAAGVDGETLATLTADPAQRQQWLDRLQKELKTKTYRPSPVRRVFISKGHGGQRPLGIPTVSSYCTGCSRVWGLSVFDSI